MEVCLHAIASLLLRGYLLPVVNITLRTLSEFSAFNMLLKYIYKKKCGGGGCYERDGYKHLFYLFVYFIFFLLVTCSHFF